MSVGDAAQIRILSDGEADPPTKVTRTSESPNNLFADAEQARLLLAAISKCDSELMGIVDRAQAVESKEVEIGIPETWWRLAHTDQFKKRLADEVEKGFISMIDLLRRNRRDIKAETLLKDWSKIKSKFLKPTVKVQ